MRKIKYLFLSCLTLILCFSMTACVWPWTTFYHEYHVIWYCDDPFIEFIGDEEIGKMTLDGTEYNLLIGHAIRDFRIYFCNQDIYVESTITNDDLIWEGTAEVKDGKLIIKIEKDYVSNYAGKTLILNQRPVEGDT